MEKRKESFCDIFNTKIICVQYRFHILEGHVLMKA
jgi:hypothetical protein